MSHRNQWDGERDTPPELSADELEAADAFELPDREAMSLITPEMGLGGTALPGLMPADGTPAAPSGPGPAAPAPTDGLSGGVDQGALLGNDKFTRLGSGLIG